MNAKQWKICYTNGEEVTKSAVEFLYKQLGNYLLRDNGVYSFYAIACELLATVPSDCHAIVLGRYGDHPIFGEYLKTEDVPVDGYVVKVVNNPENAECKLVLLCGYSARELFYAAVDLVDDYFTEATPSVDAYIRLRNELFEHPLPDWYRSTAPSFKTRSTFTWGHPINDLEQYFENLARLKLNQVIIWNDFLPLNADEVVRQAHRYGMQLMWGYSWGWAFNCNDTDVSDLETLKTNIVAEFNATYKDAVCDGIYFQSFTELPQDSINGISIAKAVTELVNMTAAALLNEHPDLHIQFGLHASSVKDHLIDIAEVDKRVEIVWEDCGGFPFKANTKGVNSFKRDAEYAAQYTFVDNILDLREAADTGLVYKCMLTMDWSRGRVTHQSGRYVLGKTGEDTKAHDGRLLSDLWRFFSVQWIENGEYAYRLTKHIKEKTDGNTNMCLAGMFSGGIWFPTALCAEMFWNCDEAFSVIRKRVLSRKWISF